MVSAERFYGSSNGRFGTVLVVNVGMERSHVIYRIGSSSWFADVLQLINVLDSLRVQSCCPIHGQISCSDCNHNPGNGLCYVQHYEILTMTAFFEVNLIGI